jgi:regulator of nucleoside diphosphate kinase
MTSKEGRIVTNLDRLRLADMAQTLRSEWGPYGGYVSELERRVQGATVVRAEDVGSDVVTMNSRVRVRDIDSGRTDTFTLVYHSNSGGLDGTVSVLTQLGSALLGAKVGDVIAWESRHGARRLKIERVLFQPEAAGHFDL